MGLALCLSTACNPKKAIEEIIETATGGAKDVIKTAVDGLKQTIDRLDTVIDEQRGKLKQDALDVLHETTNELDKLALQAATLAGLLETRVAADLASSIDQLVTGTTLLTAHIVEGTSDLAAQTARDLQRTIQTLGTTVKATINSVRPLLAQAQRVGDHLVLRVADTGSMWLLRVVGGLLAILCLIALLILIVKKAGTGWRIAFGVTTMIALAIVVLAGPLSRWFGLREIAVPDVAGACTAMETDGAQLSKALEGTTALLTSRSLLPKIEATPAALSSAVRGGDRIGLGATWLRLDARSAAAITDGDLQTLAHRVRDSAAICEVYTSSPTQAELATRLLSLALSYLGVPVVCQSSTVCKSNERCDAVTGRCLALGVYCELANHCDKGRECDVALRRCTPREQFTCNATAHCRVAESCLNGECKDDTAVLGQPCEVPTRKGPCSTGQWAKDGGGVLFCKQTVEAKTELCNGLDDNCNGFVDDVLPPEVGESCVASAPGRCAAGHFVCNGGQRICDPSGPVTEICGNGVDDDCDGHDKTCGPPPNCAGKQCGPDGAGGSCGACASGEVCRSGTCVPSSTCTPACDANRRCVGGKCICRPISNCCDFDADECTCVQKFCN